MKLLFRLLAVVVAGIVCGIAGWIVGAYIGGNYAIDFTFNGVRGYEAVGQLGFIFASIGGGVLCWLIVGDQSLLSKFLAYIMPELSRKK